MKEEKKKGGGNGPTQKVERGEEKLNMGGLGGGHYTAYARRDGRWFNFNDSQVTEVADTSRIVGTAAYVLFYKRRD